MNVKQSFRGS